MGGRCGAIRAEWSQERRARSLALRRLLDVELAHGAGDDEIVVVELERARDAVLVEFEADRIDRGLLAALLVGAVEIADGHGPALGAGEPRLAGSRIVDLFVGPDLVPDQRHGAVDLLAIV